MSYPRWICATCGEKYGNHPVGLATWHSGTCHLCGDHTSVTEPRDYGHLRQAPHLFRCVPAKGETFIFSPREIDALTLQVLEFLDRDLTNRGRGPILSITVRGLTFHRTPEGAYQRSL